MKKYILLAISLILFTGCPHPHVGDFPDPWVIFNVITETVVSGFPEFRWGELYSVPSGCYVRTRLMVYDADGELVDSFQEDLSSYGRSMMSVVKLAKGEYTAIAITSVYDKQEEKDYWTLNNISSLSQVAVVSKSYNAEKKSILGLSKLKITVAGTGETEQLINMPVCLAGALLAIEYQNIQKNADYYALTLSRKGTEINLGELCTETTGNDNTVNLVNAISTSSFSSGSTEQTYEFILPVSTQTVMRFSYGAELETLNTDNSKNVYSFSSIRFGEMYHCIFKIGNNPDDLESEVYPIDHDYDFNTSSIKQVTSDFTDEEAVNESLLRPGIEIRLADVLYNES